MAIARGGGSLNEAVPEGRIAGEAARSDSLYRRLLAVADVLSAALALVLGIAVIGDDLLTPWAFLALPVVVFVSKAIRLYDRDEQVLSKTTLDEAPSLFQVATLYTLLVWLGQEALIDGPRGGILGKDQVLGLWALLFASMVSCRASARWLARSIAPTERCLVVGDPRAADSVQAKFEFAPSLNATVVGRVHLSGDRRRNGRGPVLGSLDTLGLVLAEHQIHRVILAPRSTDAEEILSTIRLVRAMGVKVSVVPRMFEIVGSSVEFDSVLGLQLLALRHGRLSASSQFTKRALDLAGSVLGLLVLSPALLAIAAAVKLTSPGPVLFKQPRIGRHGEPFEIFKFRTMYEGADAQKHELDAHNEAGAGLFKIADDPRMTRVGRWLRRTSLDELPQLLNVARNDMSLVGPRPLVPDEDERIEGWHRARLEVQPGMTGYWQISGSSRVPIHEMVKIDYLYGANWSLWLDIKILLRTVNYAVGRRGL